MTDGWRVVVEWVLSKWFLSERSEDTKLDWASEKHEATSSDIPRSSGGQLLGVTGLWKYPVEPEP